VTFLPLEAIIGAGGGGGGGGSSWNVVSKTSTYAANNLDCVLANGTFTVTTPTTALDAAIIVKNTGTGTITVSPASGTIDGGASSSLPVQWESKSYISDGTNWFVI
jgi:hypothetical protein